MLDLEYLKKIVSQKDAEKCYEYALNMDIKLKEEAKSIKILQEVVIQSKNAQFCLYFAKNIQGANIKRLQEVVASSYNLYWCYCFARDVKGADIKLLKEAGAKNSSDEKFVNYSEYMEKFEQLENLKKQISNEN